MASAFAAQLRTIAQNSTHELDLRARRSAHAESLLFPKDVAAKQDFETIYAICIEGFRELCALDPAYVEFERNLFSAQSVRTEREQMNQSENEALDRVLERFLAIVGGKVLLKPGVRCLEWLVRRFRVHVHNSQALLLAVLPWHEMGVWRNVLSIVPKERCTGTWKFLGMYKEEALNVPRTAVVYAMTNNDGLFVVVNRYVVDAARDAVAHAGLIKFWANIVVEATVGRLDAARSGRKEVQKQRMEDLLLKVLPVLSDGFEVRDCLDLTTACFTLAMVLASKADLDDRVLDSLLHAVTIAASYPNIEMKAVIVTMTIIVSHKQNRLMPKTGQDMFMGLPNLETIFLELHQAYPIGILIESLVNGALSGMKRKNVSQRLVFIEKLLRISNSLTQQVVSTSAQAVLARILKLRTENEVENQARTGLIEVLQRLNEERSLSLAISDAAKKLNQDATQLEALLGSTIGLIEGKSDLMHDAMDMDTPTSEASNFNTLLEKTPSIAGDTTSFLAKHDHYLYLQLMECFAACSKATSTLQQFTSLPIWSSGQVKGLLILSFLLRVVAGPYTSIHKSRALRLLSLEIKQGYHEIDFQALIPYVLTALSDTAQMVRRSAADLLITMEMASAEGDVSSKLRTDLYDESVTASLKWIPASHLKQILTHSLLPSLEECVLDASQAARAVANALNGLDAVQHTPSKSSQTELKKSIRHDFFELLTSHAVATPTLRVKVNTIQLLDRVVKVGSSIKSKALGPLLEAWANLDATQVREAVESEQLRLSHVDTAMVGIICSHDKEAIGHIMSLVQQKGTRAELIDTLFDRVQTIWRDLKHEAQVSSSSKLFELAFGNNTVVATGSQDVLRTVVLTTDILGTILEQSATGITQMQNEEQQPKKKRRTSHGRDSLPPDMGRIVDDSSSRLTFALQLVDDSSPEARPELLPVLFDVLALLKRLKQQQRMALPYLHNLCLTSILAIIDAQKPLRKPSIDMSSIRADLVIDCIRSSDNPQVQSSALLLASSLSSIAPERMLHNIMPIFAFMGQSMFSKDDDHSVYVINQAIDQIIPALVNSLKSQKKNLIKSTASLLASFTTAYDHIPQHRRVATYVRLLSRMGTQDFTFIVLSMLAQRKANYSSLEIFYSGFLAELDAESQLITIQQTIRLANDVLVPKPRFADDIFGISDSTTTDERKALSHVVLKVALTILNSKTLKTQIGRLHKMTDEVAEKLRIELNNCFSLILLTIRDHRNDGSDVVEQAKQCLDALLALPSLLELFSILPQTLANGDIVDDDLKPQVLRVLATQLDDNPAKDSKTRVEAVKLLSNLTGMLEVETHSAMKQALIVCIDRISGIYGRKDMETVVSAATVVVSDSCLGSADRRLEVMSLLCLASMLEVLGEGCIPIIPEMVPKVIDILRNTAQYGLDEELHNAAFSLIAAVVSHVPFLISDENLQALLVLSSLCATKFPSTTAIESRHEAISIIARKVELPLLVTALLGEDLDVAREHPEDAELEKLDMISTAVENASKSNAIKNADGISQLLLAHLDQRSRLLANGGQVDDGIVQAIGKIETRINAISIQFIYKLNDTAFRPIFETWVDWATKADDFENHPWGNTLKELRQTSLFGLLTNFFESLKSIVTSYASYIIPVSHEILSNTMVFSETAKSSQISINTQMYINFLSMLSSTFTHDADGFYNTPSHFDPIAALLVSQLKLASSKTLRNLIYDNIVPTIVSLAKATLDTPSHHQKLSHELVQLRHSRYAPVRLASIKTFAALTADENVCDDFIANVIGIGSGEGEGARGIGGGGSIGEIMIYVNEMLEDDDEDVEREVRKWVQTVREKTGEDVFEV